MRKVFKILFLVQFAFLILVLAYLNYSGNQLRTEHDRLAEKYGVLQVNDPNKYLIRFTESESGLRELNWRVYYPPLDSVLGSQSTGMTSPNAHRHEPDYGDIRISAKFRFQDGAARAFVVVGSYRSARPIKPRVLAPFFEEHWDDLEFEILGEEMPLEFEPDQILQVLTIKVPERLLQQLPESLSQEQRDQLSDGPIMEIKLADHLILQELKP